MLNPLHDNDIFSDIFHHENDQQLQHNDIHGFTNKDYDDLIKYLEDGDMDIGDLDEYTRCVRS